MKAKFVIVNGLPDLYYPKVVVSVEPYQCSNYSNIGIFPEEE
jgi:hypothetical protein